MLDGITFYSATYRLFKIDGLEPQCEDYGQAIRYRGTVAGAERMFALDRHHLIEAGRFSRSAATRGRCWPKRVLPSILIFSAISRTTMAFLPDAARQSRSAPSLANLGKPHVVNPLSSTFAMLIAAVHDWMLSLGARYRVNPIIFGTIYIGAIPFFLLSIGWLVQRVRARRSTVVPLLSAGFWFVSAYLYLAIAGHDIPAWVWVLLGLLVAYGLISTFMNVRRRVQN